VRPARRPCMHIGLGLLDLGEAPRRRRRMTKATGHRALSVLNAERAVLRISPSSKARMRDRAKGRESGSPWLWPFGNTRDPRPQIDDFKMLPDRPRHLAMTRRRRRPFGASCCPCIAREPGPTLRKDVTPAMWLRAKPRRRDLARQPPEVALLGPLSRDAREDHGSPDFRGNGLRNPMRRRSHIRAACPSGVAAGLPEEAKAPRRMPPSEGRKKRRSVVSCCLLPVVQEG